jgi:microcystin-dependent protein
MSYNSNLPADTTAPAEIRENLRALKEDKIVDAATAVVADSAAKLVSARKISLEGDAGSTSFDGTADVSIQVDVLSADNANTLNGKTATDIMYISSPAGAVQYFAMANAPTGWLKADGSAVPRTDYANLFAAIGTTFGNGDGSTTFNLPDIRGEFIRGYDDGRGVDGNRLIGSLQNDALKNHKHYVNALFGGQPSGQGFAGANPSTDRYITGQTEATGGTETRPRNIALLACIKY